ncbi:mannitol-1-phosphate 5-dehydrogenase [Cohnella kolymensis]|uniref:Mannitol-1-phosphate 5-dehydrogenase n=1 Tax=Cohnella kolymensis TaxID=1590652 RepID=A0ABR5A223_9BACL|nr:mannitol-1-phosphate 5-dehydrogenase [Cohnella kolymensis]KIL35113.1 mannitol-1-phosphate 5-dehydrogenase [Cohnella kolymensis]KIL36522.1 mannitol-1-phosphate 5-dehydrogenase [Cohnella kolymensis]
MKAVHFGAGNIGRGFIGLLLSKSGYQVQFVDVNDQLVDLLKQRGEYTVTLANEQGDTIVVENITAINGKDLDAVAKAVAEADLVTTAVGVNILKFIAEGIARGIKLRVADSAYPLHIIACENAIGGSSQLKEHVYSHLSEEIRQRASSSVAFPNAAVDRIVPLQQHEDKLHVTVEPFFEWVVDRSAMLPGFHEIEEVDYVDNLQPYIERKLFTVNTGHCTAAYHGFLKGYGTIQDAMKDKALAAEVRETLGETGAALVREYDFNQADHNQYIDTIIERFRNPHLTDEVVRVGRSPIRKLSPNDRLVRPALMAHAHGMQVPHLARAMAAALLFDYPEDPESVELQSTIKEHGVQAAITKYTEIPETHPVHELVVAAYESLKHRD